VHHEPAAPQRVFRLPLRTFQSGQVTLLFDYFGVASVYALLVLLYSLRWVQNFLALGLLVEARINFMQLYDQVI